MATLPERIDMLERVSELYLRSYKPGEISRALGITPAQVKHYIESYKDVLEHKVNSDPEFLDKIQHNTIEALERLDMLVKEAWETYGDCKNNDMVNQQINLLKVAGTLEQQRANLLQLMGAKLDSGMMARMQKAERVNDIVSRIIKEVVSDCEKCSLQVMPRLAEAFAMMNKESEAADMRPVPEPEEDFIDVESTEMEEHEHESMMLDVIAGE